MQDQCCIELKTIGWLYGWAQTVFCAMMIGVMLKIKNYGTVVIFCKCFDTEKKNQSEF